MVIRAIPTFYAGCRFRSRGEARTAVLMDHMQWSWEYEPEGFRLPSGPYLPDFKVRKKGGDPFWLEYKAPVKEPADPRWAELAEAGGRRVFVLFGLHRDGDDCTRDHWLGGFSPDGASFVLRSAGTRRWNGITDEAWAAASGARFEFGESGAGPVERFLNEG